MAKFNEVMARGRAKKLSPVVLAFVGDAAYTLLVRTELAESSAAKANELNKKAAEIVSAHGQSGALERMLPLLTEEEEAVYRRGRNAKKATKSKNATVSDYVRSTGFEALLGYLYLTGQTERIQELFLPDKEEK